MSASVPPPPGFSGVDLRIQGKVQVRPEGGSGRTVDDFRLPSYTPEQLALAEQYFASRGLEKLAPIVAAVRTRVGTSWMTMLAELNGVAGGQASTRATMLAHYAMKAHTALELAHLVAETAVAEARDQADARLRNAAGIAIVATDLLNKAYAAAEAEGKAKAAKLEPVDALMATLGVPGPDGEGSAQVPDLTGGVGSIGAPLPQNPSSSAPSHLGPLSQPKPAPAAPRLNLDPESPSVFAAPLPKKPPRRKGDST